MSEHDDPDPAGLMDYFSQVRGREEKAVEIYDALRATSKLKDHRLITYRCAVRRCLLLDIVRVPGAKIAHIPGYRLSPSVNERDSNEDGRRANTTDGVRRWKAHTVDLTMAANFPLTCDHIHGQQLELPDLDAAIAAGHAVMLVRPDGERCPG